ncbi:MAG: PAS domain-containing protein, partial [Flavobacteriales bacterium]|nr:PAS domain-containing protein [Flavobacteriales bacterium]
MQAEIDFDKEKYALILENNRIGIWEWPNLGAPEKIWSARMYDIMECSPTETKSSIDKFLEMAHPEDRERIGEALNKHLAKEAEFVVECRIRKKDGGYKWVKLSGQATWD